MAGQFGEHLVMLLANTKKKGHSGGSALKVMHEGGVCRLEDMELSSYVKKEGEKQRLKTMPSLDWGSRMIGFLKKSTALFLDEDREEIEV